MLSRRSFLQSAGAVAATLPLQNFAFAASAPASSGEDLLKYIDPMIGTGGHGHCFPGASMPFSAVQLSPDTYNDGWDWCSGYHISDTSIMGFSHTHLSGTGAGDLLDFLVMAGTGPVKLKPGSREHPEEGYRSRFSHDQEHAEPGYYSVFLQDPKVKVELTSTERTGIHAYHFPASQDAWLIVDLAHTYMWNNNSAVYTAEMQATAPDTLAGGHVTRAWGHDRHCYFTMQVSQQPTKVVFYSDDKPVDGTGMLKGDNLKAVLHFTTTGNEPIYVRTGISGVSPEGAGKNLQAEQPDFNFARTRAAARKAWADQVGRVRAELPTQDQRKIFYTALYHMTLGPQLFDDVDGNYRGMDAQIHQVPAGQHNYTTFSLWDTFRAAHPAYTIMETERVPDFANSLIRMAQQSEEGMPVWPLQGTETGTMTGYHSASVIAEAIVKGFPGIDPQAAYDVMEQRALVENYRGLGYYRQLGYIPADREDESVSKSFEYCYADWAVAHVAKKVGKNDVAEMLRTRSDNFKNNFNHATLFMEPKMFDGTWATPFDPIEMGHSKKWRDYTESNAWQASFGIQNDPAGLIALYGTRADFIKRLDMLFTVPSTLPPDAPPDIAGLVGQYAHGNEPSHHISYLYVYAGAPYKTQSRARMLMDTMYHAAPDGMAGNEDVGQMSAWYLLSALGFYTVDPVSGIYVLGSPIIEKATISVGNGKELRIEVKRKNPAHAYVESFTLNGQKQNRTWFRHDDIRNGGTLVFEMSANPNMTLGAGEDTLPPSLVF